MKKALALILLAALVLCAFTSCDEEVAANTITFEITDTTDFEWTFSDGKTTAVIEIPSGCTSWGDLVDKSFAIELKDKSSTVSSWTLSKDSGNYIRFTEPSYDYVYGYVYKSSKGTPPVDENTAIVSGETYELFISEPQ